MAAGRLIYHGPQSGLLPWLSEGLGYDYDPLTHGLLSDWALDLVATGFDKPQVTHPVTGGGWHERQRQQEAACSIASRAICIGGKAA